MSAADAVAALEAQIAASPDDPAAYAVLGDVLERAGDPRGALIALQLAAQAAAGKPGKAADKLRAAAEAHFAAHARAFLGPLAPHAAGLTWRSGFIRRIALASSERVGVADVVAKALAHPSGRFVVELAAQIDYHGDAQQLLSGLAKAPPRALRELELIARGRRLIADARDPDHDTRGALDVASALAGVPWLERLAITTPAIELGAPAQPALRRLRLTVATLTSGNMRAIVKAGWPALERLELRFGTREDDPATFAGVRPLLARRDLPALTHLRLRNAPFAGGILRELLQAPLAKQLAVVDLSHGSMSPADAAALVRDPAPLAHLRELWLPMRLLRATDRAALAALGTHVIDDVRAARDETDPILGYSGL